MTIEIANRLIELRKAKGLSQEELAEKLSISRQAVSKWERAESSPDIDNIMALSRLYGVSVDELLCNENSVSMDESELVLAGSPEPDDTPVGSVDGVRNVEICGKAEVELIGTDGGECCVSVDGPEEEKERVRIFTEGDTLKITRDDEDEGGFFSRLFSFDGKKSVSITVRLPRKMNSVEPKIKGGSIKVSRLSADSIELITGGGRTALEDCSVRRLEIKTGGGSMILRNVSGNTCELKTGGGSIKAEAVDFNDRLEAKTGGGSVVVSGRTLEVEASSGGGDVRLDLIAPERVEARTGGGGVEVSLREVEGIDANLTSGGGRARVVMKGETVMSGRSVTMQSGEGRRTAVEAKSGGGSVVLTVN